MASAGGETLAGQLIGKLWELTRLSSTDYIFLIIVLALFGGIAFAVKGASIQDGLNKQKEAMKVSRCCCCINNFQYTGCSCSFSSAGKRHQHLFGRFVGKDKQGQGVKGRGSGAC